jgi:hypothetical protein
MESYGLSFHHFGLAVTAPEKAISFLKGLNYSIGETIYDELQNVNLIMCKSETMPDVEVIYRADTPGPLDSILKSFREVIYHLCYTTADLQDTLKRMRDDMHRIIDISPPKRGVLFSGKMVSFYQVVGFGIIEIIEK